jgi:ParB/RepB/Spo0J family partition protein
MDAPATLEAAPAVDRTATFLLLEPRGSKPFEAARLIPHTLLKASPTNPRHWFDQAKMAELRESIRVHNVQQPLLVRLRDDAVDGEPLFEIVDGERRWRNVVELAGDTVVDLPCVVTAIDAHAARELQLLSAIQRDDLHPLDEADGFAELLTDPPGKPRRPRGYTIAELAHRAGKSTRYVHARLALCPLQRDARAAFYDGKITIGTAHALARLAELDQAEAAAYIVKGNGSGPLTHEEAMQYIQRSFMLRLNQATWLLHDETVLPEAGSCTLCPKRTGANPELFQDISVTADTCTDRACFHRKAAAARTQVIDAARARGYAIITGSSAKAMMPTRSSFVKGHERLDQPCEMALSNKPLREVLGKKFTAIVLIDNESIGALVEVAPTAAVKRALAGMKLLKEPAKSAARTSKASTPKVSEPPKSTASDKPASAPTPAPALPSPKPAEAGPVHAPDEDLQVLLDIEGLGDRIVGQLGKTPPDDKAMARMQRDGADLVRSILTACAIGRQMREDGAEGLPAEGLEYMLLALLLHGDMHCTWPIASRIAGVTEAPQTSNLKVRQAWARGLSSEEACRMVMVALALTDPLGDADIRSFPETCARALGTGIGYVDAEAQRIARERIQLELVRLAPKAPEKPVKKAAAKGGAQ